MQIVLEQAANQGGKSYAKENTAHDKDALTGIYTRGRRNKVLKKGF
ncbi:hypothetical protein ABENE_12835 [Asticcacaulis benevestitus DSM 16100 = ATCC BAA-896]|uniref:Uncharacterized protein n=1 Tax=Asticcacaulis benevestitus DSM 16100 = ATCC BAA-896 TaxID=1121022 RepID=V4RFY5_9CAUL|nr:hypothetical protein ABENE_12835 [Asticcacaulis benevestitus DSM 16100 = ATCC BAA-896]